MYTYKIFRKSQTVTDSLGGFVTKLEDCFFIYVESLVSCVVNEVYIGLKKYGGPYGESIEGNDCVWHETSSN